MRKLRMIRRLVENVHIFKGEMTRIFEVFEMCEFKVLLKGENVYRDVIYAKASENKVMVKDVLGSIKVFEDCKIVEVDVGSERLVLAPA